MRAAWNPGDLPIRRSHLMLVRSREGEADSLGAGRSPSQDATVSPSLPRRGVQLTAADLTDLEQLAVVVDRMENATHALKQAVKKRDVGAAQTAARAVLHIGLRAGDFSRQMETRA